MIDRLNIRSVANDENPTIYQAKGCEKCDGTGFVGRLGLFEILGVDDGIRRLILSSADMNDIQSGAVGAGMRTMRDDGLRKACAGLTTIDEVLRVTQEI